MGKLFVAIDFFYSAAYGPDAPGMDYSHDRDHLYMVLQPFLAGGNHAEAVKVGEYLRDWNGVRLSAPGSFAVAGRTDNFVGVPVTPVPFPPGTEIALRLAWEPGARTWEARRTLGLWQAEGNNLPTDPTRLPAGLPVTDPLVLARAGWPDFAIENFTNPIVGVWSHLTPPQRGAVLDWLVTLISSLHDQPPASGTLAGQIWDRLAGQPPRTTDPATWRAYLLPSAWQPGQPTPPAGGIFELLFQKAGPDDAALQPPRFHYGIDELRAHPEVLLGDTSDYRVTASSYHRRLWESLRRFLAGGTATPDERERQAGDALGRLFGFGERLRWPASAGPIADGLFMKLRRQAENLPGWCVTNVHSLLGQVFRVGPVDLSVDMASAVLLELTIQGQPLLTGNAPGQTTSAGAPISKEDQFADDFVKFQRAARNNQAAGPSFRARLARDSGFTLFAPKASEASKEAGNSPDGRTLYSVPGVLLDALEPERRTDMPMDSDLLKNHPPRAALTAAELFHPERLLPERATGEAEPRLYRPRLQVKVKVVPLPLTAAATPVYEVSLAGQAHPREEPFLRRWMNDLGRTGRGAALWVSPASETPVNPRQFLLNGTCMLRIETRDTEEVAIVTDPGDQPEKLTDLLAAAPRTSGGDSRVDLVFESRAHRPAASEDQEEPFNLLEALPGAPAEAPTLVLNRSVTHRVSLSADRLMERFGLTLDPSPFAGNMAARNPDPVLDHAANFNKLRVELTGGRGTVSLNHPDALMPLDTNMAAPPWGGGRLPQPAGPHFDYWLAHHFSQEVRDDAVEAETGRYLGYTSAGEPWRLAGHVEHQYSHRLSVEGQEPVALRLSTDVIHLGRLTFRGRLVSEPALLDPKGHEITPRSRTALTFDHRKEPGGETLEISFRRKAFRLALERWNEGGSDRSTWLRELYGALADLRAALEPGGTAEVVLERWNFDNTDPASMASDDPQDAFPSILRRMRRVEKGTFPLALLPQAEKAELAEILGLLDLPFPDFLARLNQLVGQGLPGEDADREADSAWRTLTLPLARNTAGWTWTGTPGDPISQTTDAVRAGLLLRRPAGRVLLPAVGNGALLPLEDQSPQMAGLSLQELEAQARRELQDYVSPTAVPPSPLYEAFSWLRSEDVDARATPPANPADGLFDPNRHDQLFGEVSPFLNFPTGLRSSVPQVMDLYYVPYAFVPLKVHPLLGDGQTTLEFAQYLVSLLEDVAEGRPLGAKLETAPDAVPATEALALRQQARDLINGNNLPGPGVARRLLDLLDPVDDPHGLDDWPVPAEKDLFEKVQAQVARLESLADDGLIVAQLALLTASPSLFTTTRAIAAGVFEPATWTEQLYALQLAKRIRDNLPESVTAGLERSDWERFAYPQFSGRGRDRYFLDVLEAGRYDDEIEIDQNVYQGIPPSDTSRLGEVRVLAEHPIQRRGGAQARAAEDLIEQIHSFDAPPKPGAPPPPANPPRRTIEANVVHYNPEWRVRKKETGEIVSWSYLLPSRRFPALPKPVLPSPAGSSGEGHDSPWSSEFIPTFPDAGAIDLDTAFDAALTDVLERRKAQVELSSAAPGETIRARRLHADGHPAVASADRSHRKGWHFIDSYLSHYYFVIEADEANQQVFDSLKNDAFEIEVEIWDRSLPADTPREASKVEMKTPLQKWFVHYRSPRSPRPDVLPTPEATLAEIRSWLIEPREVAGLNIKDELLRRQVERNRVTALAEDATASQRVGRTTVRFGYAGADGWRLTPQIWETTPGNDVGGVMAAEVLERIDTDNNSIRGAYLLRVSVLDDPWHFTRVHMRVKRNDRDVDGNSNSDINPTFAMETEFSPWVSYGRHVLSLGPEDLERYRLPSAVRRLDVNGGSVSLADWLNESKPDTMSFGPIVHRAIAETRFTDTRGEEYPFWNVDEARHPDRRVSGIVLQILEDTAPRKSLAGAPRPVAKRRDLLARQHLPQQGADKLETLTGAIRRDLVRTATPLLRITWFNAGGEALLEVTWPVEIHAA